MDATDTTGIWAKIYKIQLGSHGVGAATADGDERHRPGAVGHQGQGGRLAALQAAGRHQQAGAGLCRRHLARLPAARLRWSAEAVPMVEAGYRALKLRVGDTREGRHRAHDGGAPPLRRRHRHPDRRQHRLLGGRRAPGDAGDGRAQHRLAGGAVPGARPPLLRHGQGLRPHAARRRREPLHALRVPSRDRGRQHHHPAARSLQERRHHRGAAHRGRGLDVEAADPSAFAR